MILHFLQTGAMLSLMNWTWAHAELSIQTRRNSAARFAGDQRQESCHFEIVIKRLWCVEDLNSELPELFLYATHGKILACAMGLADFANEVPGNIWKVMAHGVEGDQGALV